MSESFRPSKRFLIRGAVATGIVAIVLIVQTDWFRALFNKPPLSATASDKTVGEFIAQDTNGNGIADWEEKLWGLDPTTLYTDGVPNKQIIEEKKSALGVANTNTEPENETDELAKELFTITAALGQSGGITDESLAAVGARLAESVEFQEEINHYSIKDIKTVQTTGTSLNQYYKTFGAISTKHETSTSELEILVQALESGDLSGMAALEPIKKDYEQYARELIALSVPVGVQGQHLEITNSIFGLSAALGYLGQLEDNGAHALVGVALYKVSDARLVVATEALREYFTRYGILHE